MGDKNPKKRPKKAKITLKPEFTPVTTVGAIKAGKDAIRKTGQK